MWGIRQPSSSAGNSETLFRGIRRECAVFSELPLDGPANQTRLPRSTAMSILSRSVRQTPDRCQGRIGAVGLSEEQHVGINLPAIDQTRTALHPVSGLDLEC